MAIGEDDLRAAIPRISGTLRVKGLRAKVAIFRDHWGIPHVRAENVSDAFFGQGFATAQDRFWHMDLDRRRAYGRCAELLGPTAVAQDRAMRGFQLQASARRDYELSATDPDTRSMLDSYAAGVNAFLSSTTVPAVEYRILSANGSPADLVESWNPWDCLAVFKTRHVMMGTHESKMWRARLVGGLGPAKAAELLKGYQPGHLLIVPPRATFEGPVLDGLDELRRDLEGVEGILEDPGAGSNSWAVSGSRTGSGKPLLAGDPHRLLDTPNTYYQNHISCREFDVVGLSFPGCPGFPHFGHNAHVAWCVTHAGADYQDLFVERMRGRTGAWQYAYRGEWMDAEAREETIRVRGGSPVRMETVLTRHGPVIAGDLSTGYGMAFRYTATAEPNSGFRCIRRMLAADSADAMDQAMRDWVDPCNNFLVVDVKGAIAYLMRGQVPIRSMANAWLPVPGWTGNHEWKGHIPFAELPRIRDPESGFIVTANNRIAGGSYPHYIALDYAPEYRARRIVERLRNLRNATVADMMAIHADRVSIPAQIYQPLLLAAPPRDDWSTMAQRFLKDWDGAMDADAVAPTIYCACRRRLLQTVTENLAGSLAKDMMSATGRGAPVHLQQLAARLASMARDGDASWLPAGEDWPTVVSRALAQGIGDLRERFGDDMEAWKWGAAHRTRPRHPLSELFPGLSPLLDPPRVSVGGDGDTPQAAAFGGGQSFDVTGLSVARYVFDAAEWDNSRWVVPLGASGHPGSPHYTDQAPIWAAVQAVPMLFGWERIAGAAEDRLELVPTGGS